MLDCVVSLGLNCTFMNVSHEHRPIYLMKKNKILIKPSSFQSSFCSLFMYGSAALDIFRLVLPLKPEVLKV